MPGKVTFRKTAALSGKNVAPLIYFATMPSNILRQVKYRQAHISLCKCVLTSTKKHNIIDTMCTSAVRTQSLPWLNVIIRLAGDYKK